MSAENWKAVLGASGYQASNFGRIRSVDRWVEQEKAGTRYRRFMRGKVLQASLGSNGRYLNVAISYDDGRRVSRNVHVLVALAFLGEKPSDKHQVAHRDGNGRNNNVDNLRWATPVSNSSDRRGHGTHLEGETHPSTKIPVDVVRQIRRMRAAGLSARKTAQQFGVSTMQAWRIGKGHRRAASV